MLRIVQKAVIEDGAADFIVNMARKRTIALRADLMRAGFSQKAKNFLPFVAGIAKGDSGVVDKELTRIRNNSNLVRVYARSYHGAEWLIAETKDVVVKSGYGTGTWNYGPYEIAFSSRLIRTDVHFIPLLKPRSVYRNLHQYASATTEPEHRVSYHSGFAKQLVICDGEYSVDPLDVIPSTCWSSYAETVSNFFYCGLAVDLVGVLTKFCFQWNYSSPLIRDENLSFRRLQK